MRNPLSGLPRLIPLCHSFLILATGMALLLGFATRVYAQPEPAAGATFPLRIPYEEQSPRKAARPVPRANLPHQLTRAEKAQLEKTRQIAQRLSQESDESFRRGLLPLGDHLRQLLLSYSLRQNLARFGAGESLQSVNGEERERYQGIVRQLENFNQPAAEGWAADLALARMYLARVEAETASLQGETGAMFAALSRQAESARQHVTLRGFDEALGMAPPQAVVEAAQLERRASLEALPRNPSLAEYRTAFGAYRDQLAEMESQVERWSDQGAGIGRADKLHLVRFEVAQADAILETLNGNEAARQPALKAAERELTNLFESQQQFYRHGTASLFELTRTWSDRQSIFDQASDLKDFRSQESVASHTRDFQTIQQLANQTQDTRGRIAADLEFIKALDAEQEFVTLRNSINDPFRSESR